MKSIVTLNGYFNYGNRLQLFALAKVTEKLGSEVTIYWPKRFKTRVKEFLKYWTPLRFRFKKEIRIRHFTKKYIPRIVNSGDIDYSIVGSDQVWNPEYLQTKPYLLKADHGKVKISYAASIGKETLTKEQLQLFEKNLKDYKAISVREQSAKKLLQPLTDKKIEVVLDPTLLLDSGDYEKLEKRPHDIKLGEKYILCYILGGKEQKNIIDEFAAKHGYKVIMFSDKEGSNYGIEDFLYLIHHAELICTDSFHACVFSFVFERPFVAFKRTGEANYMYTRLQNFIDTFKLQNREFNGKKITNQNAEIDYTEAKKILRQEKEKSFQFLKDALTTNDEKNNNAKARKGTV